MENWLTQLPRSLSLCLFSVLSESSNSHKYTNRALLIWMTLPRTTTTSTTTVNPSTQPSSLTHSLTHSRLPWINYLVLVGLYMLPNIYNFFFFFDPWELRTWRAGPKLEKKFLFVFNIALISSMVFRKSKLFLIPFLLHICQRKLNLWLEFFKGSKEKNKEDKLITLVFKSVRAYRHL